MTALCRLRWHPEYPRPQPVILRYLDRPHRPWEVASRRHAVPQLIEIVPLAGCELPGADSIHALALRRSPGPSSTPRRRGAFESQTTSLSVSIPPLAPPPAGLTSGRSGLHGPFAQTPLQCLHRSYGPSRPCASRYSAPCGVCRLGSSLSQPGADFTHFDWPTVPRRQVLLFHASACDELTPPLHRTPSGPHAGSSLTEGEEVSPLAFVPRTSPDPRFRRRFDVFRCVSSGSHMFVFSSLT